MNKITLKLVLVNLLIMNSYGQSTTLSDDPAIIKKVKSGASKDIKESNPLIEKRTLPEVEELEVENGRGFGLHGTFSYLDTWLPGKMGLTVSYGDEKRTYELAYQKASYSFDVIIDDLGTISDQRIHLTTRSHTWESSFNFQYGLYYNKFSAELGNAYTNLLSSPHSLIEVQTLGVMWGVGNKWRWKSWEFSSDWFKIFWPIARLGEESEFLSDTNDESDKDDIQELIDTVSGIPTFSLFHIELGYRF
jgi:hypothetical protein